MKLNLYNYGSAIRNETHYKQNITEQKFNKNFINCIMILKR